MHNHNDEVEFISLNIDKLLTDLNIKVDADNLNVIQKNNRPFYTDVEITETITALIPIRTNLSHKYGFITKNTENKRSGLDYTKMFLVETKNIPTYKNELMTIQNKEYKKINSNRALIKKNVIIFLIEFYDCLQKPTSDRSRNEDRLINFSALQYQEQNLKECIKIISNN